MCNLSHRSQSYLMVHGRSSIVEDREGIVVFRFPGTSVRATVF